jgi:prophage endopeptidase
MNRLEFIIAISAVLFVAFALGWFSHWLLRRFTRVSKADLGEFEKMAQELHEAEETRGGIDKSANPNRCGIACRNGWPA